MEHIATFITISKVLQNWIGFYDYFDQIEIKQSIIRTKFRRNYKDQFFVGNNQLKVDSSAAKCLGQWKA